MRVRNCIALLVVVLSAVACKERLRLPTEPTSPSVPNNPTVTLPSDTVWLTGTVGDASHPCLSGAEVTVSRSGTVVGRSTTTCAQPANSYIVKGFREGDMVTIAIAREGYQPQQVDRTLHGDVDGWARVDFILQPAGGLR